MKTFSDLANKLIHASPIHPATADLKSIPKSRGVYIWSLANGEIVYAGSATGINGLYGRIVGQHLNPLYLLTLQDKWHKEKDAYQIRNHATSNSKPAIDKSALRKNIGRKNYIKPGKGTVDFIYNNFVLRYITLSDATTAKMVEAEIIREAKPKYNIVGK